MARTTVLLIDDNEDDALFIRRAFEKCAPNCAFEHHLDGRSALDAMMASARATPPDLILLDINLPGFTGFDVLERIRGAAELMASVVIIISTSRAAADVRRAYRLRANAFLTKPEDLTSFDAIAERIVEFWFETATLPNAV